MAGGEAVQASESFWCQMEAGVEVWGGDGRLLLAERAEYGSTLLVGWGHILLSLQLLIICLILGNRIL